MAVLLTDLVGYVSAGRPEDDTSTSGGTIDVDSRATLTPLAATDALEVVSDNAGDTTPQVTVTGRDASGLEISDTKTLTGTSPVAFAGTFERVTKVLMDADAVGIVTVRRTGAGATVCNIPAGERGATQMFIASASDSVQLIRYEKVCWRNNNATLSLLSAKVTLTADPDSRIRMGVEATKNAATSVANRLTAPGGITFVDDGVEQSVPGDALESSAFIGVWIEQDLPIADTPKKSSFTTSVSGVSA